MEKGLFFILIIITTSMILLILHFELGEKVQETLNYEIVIYGDKIVIYENEGQEEIINIEDTLYSDVESPYILKTYIHSFLKDSDEKYYLVLPIALQP